VTSLHVRAALLIFGEVEMITYFCHCHVLLHNTRAYMSHKPCHVRRFGSCFCSRPQVVITLEKLSPYFHRGDFQTSLVASLIPDVVTSINKKNNKHSIVIDSHSPEDSSTANRRTVVYVQYIPVINNVENNTAAMNQPLSQQLI
jgi:hypothetical protein